MSEAPGSPWGRAALAASLFALDPLGSGVWLRAGAGPVRDAWLARLGPTIRMPCDIADDRLLGGLDVAATLRVGRPVAETGLLAAADGGVIAAAMAERMRAGVAARLAAALDRGEVALARDGLSLTLPARIGLVALDEGIDETAPPALIERLAFWVDLDAVGWRDVEPPVVTAAEIAAARARLPRVATPSEALEHLVKLAAALGIASLRAPLFALRAARGLAALRAAVTVGDEDVEIAAALVLGPRATRLPAPPEEPPEAEPEPPEPESQAHADETPRELEDAIREAARALLPDGLLGLLAARATRSRSGGEGKAGEERISHARGAPLEPRPGSPAKGRLALVATLRAAAPWRKLRDPDNRDPRRVLVRGADIRIRRFREKRGATTVFLLDASGSQAMHRLAEVKGAIELLLADCYIRRDEVALIAFRGRAGEILLSPTRSTARARRALSGLPGGGGTPIASALDLGLDLATGLRRKGRTPFLVLMSDGRANIARDGAPGRPRAMQDALASARRIAAAGIAALAIDTAPPATRDEPTRALAQAMAAPYVKLPLADAARVDRAVRAARPA